MPSTGMRLAVFERDGTCSIGVHIDPRDRGVHADLAAVVAEERLHRLRELDGPALADRPAPRLHRAGDHHRVVRAQAEDVAGPGELGHPEPDPRLDLRRLEQVPRDVVRRRQELPDQPEAVRPHRLEGQQVAARRAGRGEHRRDHAVGEHLSIDVRQLAERRRVARREPGDPLDGLVQIAGADQRASVREDVPELVLGPDVLRAVPLELQVAVHRSHVDDAVEVRVEVVTEPRGRDLLRGAAAPDDVARLQDQDAACPPSPGSTRTSGRCGRRRRRPRRSVQSSGSSHRCRASDHASSGDRRASIGKNLAPSNSLAGAVYAPRSISRLMLRR